MWLRVSAEPLPVLDPAAEALAGSDVLELDLMQPKAPLHSSLAALVAGQHHLKSSYLKSVPAAGLC